MALVKVGCQPEEFVNYKDPEEYVKMELTTFPLHYPAPRPVNYGIPEKWLKIMAKYKYSWRIIQLAKHLERKARKKYGWKPPPKPEEPTTRRRRRGPDPEIQFYSDQLSRAPIRTLTINKKLYGKLLDSKHRGKLRRTLNTAWDSIYNYYKKKERDRYLRQLRIMKREKKASYVFDRTDNLAKPKKLYVPPKKSKDKEKKKKNFKECAECKVHLVKLAAPKVRKEPRYNKLGVVKKAAMLYLITKETLALTKPFERFKKIKPPLPLGKVKKSALLYQITNRTEILAVPRKRTEAGADDEDWNPFAISKWALRYRPSKRIIELAKPRIRE